MIEKAVKSCLEAKKQLKDQMATLKKNRDNVPLDVLKTKYKKDYTALYEDLHLLTSDFIKSIVLKDTAVMPKYMPDVVQIIETIVKDSGPLKECSKAVYRQQDFEELEGLAKQLRELALRALDEFYMKYVGLYIAPECPKESYPLPYYLNLIANQYYNGTRWTKI